LNDQLTSLNLPHNLCVVAVCWVERDEEFLPVDGGTDGRVGAFNALDVLGGGDLCLSNLL